MIRHIVMFKLIPFPTPEEKLAAAETLKKELMKMRPQIPLTGDFEVGINFCPDAAAWDVVINSTFRNREDLEVYRVHPDHQAFIAFNKNYSEKKAVIDYEFDEPV